MRKGCARGGGVERERDEELLFGSNDGSRMCRGVVEQLR